MKRRNKKDEQNNDRPGQRGARLGSSKFNESDWIRDGNGRFAGYIKQNAPLTDNQKVLLKDYKEGGYREINAYLNKNAGAPLGTGEQARQIKAIDSAIAKSTLGQDMVVYRGISHRGLAKQAETLVGKTITSSAYLSTSASSRVARDFAGFGEGSVVFAIKAKKGTPAVYMNKFETAGNANEEELLFGRETKIRITGVNRTRTPPVIMGEFE